MKEPKWKEVGQFCQLALEQDIEGWSPTGHSSDSNGVTMADFPRLRPVHLDPDHGLEPGGDKSFLRPLPAAAERCEDSRLLQVQDCVRPEARVGSRVVLGRGFHPMPASEHGDV